jgi:succinoglycan biosynthesis transport protein ExoP
MHTNRLSHSMPKDSKSLTLQDYLEIFWRRKWWFILPLIVGTSITILYSYSLPSIYRSSTLILVEPQQVPTSYVSSTVTYSMQDRLNTIKPQILSRTNLERIAREFALYEKAIASVSARQEDVGGPRQAMMAKAKEILVALGLYEKMPSVALGPQTIPEEFIDGMRKSITVELVGGGKNEAFTVAFEGREPHTVMQVTNTLASLFIEENLKVREKLVEETSEFLDLQLKEAQAQLEKQERALQEFKKEHMGMLPEQMDVNLKALDRLQLELQSLNEALRNTEERSRTMDHTQLEMLTLSEALRNTSEQTSNVNSNTYNSVQDEPELDRLKKELAQLQSQFNDTYPDVIALKRRINETETRLAVKSTVSEPGRQTQSAPPQESRFALQLQTGLQTQLQTMKSEIRSLRERRDGVTNLIKEYQKKIDNTFTNAQQLVSLNRGYELSQSNYQSLLSKKLNAKLSENLEKKQKGEKFRILDPAHTPVRPYKPNVPKIILSGSVLSGGLGVGLVLLLEYLKAVFRKPEDFHGVSDIPILVSIPRYEATLQHQENYLPTLEERASLITEQYRMLYTKISGLIEQKTKKVFAISSAMPGDGKTVTALNLAVVIARDFGKKTLLLEGDFRKPSLAVYLKMELEEGLVDLLLSNTDMRSNLIPFADTLIPFADDHLSVLPAVKSVQNSIELVSSRRIQELIETVKEQYDVILIDAPPILPLADMSMFEKVVDGIVLVVRAERTPRNALVRAIDTLATDKLVGVVLNDTQPLRPLSYYPYPYAYKKM